MRAKLSGLYCCSSKINMNGKTATATNQTIDAICKLPASIEVFINLAASKIAAILLRLVAIFIKPNQNSVLVLSKFSGLKRLGFFCLFGFASATLKPTKISKEPIIISVSGTLCMTSLVEGSVNSLDGSTKSSATAQNKAMARAMPAIKATLWMAEFFDLVRMASSVTTNVGLKATIMPKMLMKTRVVIRAVIISMATV